MGEMAAQTKGLGGKERPFVQEARDWLWEWRPAFNNFWLHVSYFTLMSLLGGTILWALESADWTDTLFIAVSALCVTGLFSVDFSKFSVDGQVFTLIWIQAGGFVLFSTVPVIIRFVQLHLRTRKQPYPDKESIKAKRVLLMVALGVVGYVFLIEFLAFLILGLYFEVKSSARKIVTSEGLNAWWWSIFHTISAFQNAGFSLFTANIVPMARDTMVQLVLSTLIICGNTGWPIIGRCYFWVLSRIVPGKYGNALRIFLENPRHYYTSIFPFRDTAILAIIWSIVTLVEYALFFVEWNTVLKEFSLSKKFLVAWFQTVSIRTCGFNNVDLSIISMGTLTLWIFTMYLSAYPFIATLHLTEEGTRKHSLRNHLKRVLTRDTAWLFVALLLISYIQDGSKAEEDVLNPSLRIAFEISSAYGTVGLTTGFPGKGYSYSGGLHWISKYILMSIMLAGRLRGLPSPFDPAVRFTPKEEKEDVEGKTDLEMIEMEKAPE